MDRSALRAPHPSVPTLTHGRDSKDKRVFSILRDLDKIKTSKKKKQIKRCELLINNIAQLLRKNSGDDHLFQTTSIWVLITIFRLFPSDTKGMMTAAGIPGCLFDVIKNGNLSGSSRQYASELCFYLSTNHPHPGDAWGSGAPMDMLPEVQMVNRYRPDLDDVTMLSDVSSNAEEIKTRQAFVPYRIDPHNMQKLDALFEEGYHNQLAASLPNHLLLSKYGFSSYIREKGEIESSDDEDDEDLDDEDEKGNRHAKDDDSAFSSISSASRSTSMTLGGSLPNSSRRFDFNLSHSLADVLPGGDLDSARSRTSQASFSRMKNKNYANDLIADLTGKRSKPTQFSPFGLGKLRRQDSETSQGSIGSAQPPHPSRLPVQVVNKPYSSLQPIVPQSLQTLETARSFGSLEAAAHTRNEISPQLNRHRSYSHHAIEKQSHVAASTPARIDHHVSGTPHRMIQHLRNDRSSTSHMPHRMASNTATLQRSRDVHSAHPLSQSLDTGLTAPKEIGVFGDWVMPYRPSKHAGLGENSQVLQSKSFFSSEFEDTMEKPSNDIDAYFSNLDPLALSLKSTVKSHHKVEQSGIVPVEEEEGGWILSSDEDDELYEGIKAGGDWDNEDDEDDLAQITNEFVLKKRLRMRAEKLIDHSFVRKLFVKKSKVQDSQDLIHRMEQLLELLDPDKSGYITFEAFTRLILAVAPRHVVRADVMNFMNAQSKRNDDLVDYNEFIISGKVLILTKAQRQQALEDRSRLRNLPKGAKEAFEYRNESSSTMVWLKRQKEYVGQNSTYTWKNHLKWYQRRKAQALIWLVRRATRSLKHEVVLDEARRFLALKAKHAIAWSELIEIGRASLRTQSKGAMAKRRLMKRAMHARRFMIKLTEAQEYLRGTALTAIKDLDYMDRVLSVREKRELVSRGEVTEAKIALAKKTQANYAALFKMKALRNLAIQFLVDHSRKAMVHCARQDEALDFMRAMVYKAQKQLTLKDKARRELLLRAEAAYAFCLAQDQALLNLLRVGGDALMHMDRQVKALSWLIQRGEEAHKFTEGKLKTRLELVKIGQRTLRYMNRREEAHIYLNKRRLKSQAFVIRRKEAIHFLKECPRDVWRIIDNCNAAQAWLVARAARAKIYVVNRIRAAHHLQHIAAKASFTYRRSYIAQQELCQIGMMAKYDNFKKFCHQIPALVRVLKSEKSKNLKYERKQKNVRATWTFEEHLKLEMADVFQLLTSVYTPPNLAAKNKLKKLDAITAGGEVDDFTEEHHFIGIYAFRKMVNNGRIFNIPLAEVNEFFRNADVTASCYITLEAILPWMRAKASKIKNFKFRMSDVMSAEEKAYISVYLRMLRDKNFLQTATDYSKYEEMMEAKRRLRLQKQLDEWSDDDEDDEEEEIDEDVLFSDLEKMRNMDVGRLMRYLTRKREIEQQKLAISKSQAAAQLEETKQDGAMVPAPTNNAPSESAMVIVNEVLDATISVPSSPEKPIAVTEAPQETS